MAALDSLPPLLSHSRGAGLLNVVETESSVKMSRLNIFLYSNITDLLLDSAGLELPSRLSV